MTPSQRGRSRKAQAQSGRLATSTTRGLTTNAIRYGSQKAKVPNWHPNQLRHNAATSLRKEFGLDVARVILGHSSPAVTEVLR